MNDAHFSWSCFRQHLFVNKQAESTVSVNQTDFQFQPLQEYTHIYSHCYIIIFNIQQSTVGVKTENTISKYLLSKSKH